MTGHECDTGIFDRAICPEPCDTMHSYCTTCGERQDSCAHEVKRTGGKHSDVRLYGEADLAEAERRGAERGWDEGWRFGTGMFAVIEPLANPYRAGDDQ